MVTVGYACSTSKPNVQKTPENKSHYHILRLGNSQAQDSAIIIGNAYNISSAIDSKIKCFAIEVNNKIPFKDECNGRVKFSLTPDNYNFGISIVGYDSVKTHKFFISNGDSIKIDFYLEQDISLHEK